MKIKLWRKPLKPAEPEVETRPRPGNYTVTEAVDGTEPIESMRLYTQADFEEAVRHGQSLRPDYQVIWQYGFSEGRKRPRPMPPRATWNQKDALYEAYLKGIDTVIDKLGLGGYSREEFNLKAREMYLAEHAHKGS